MDTVRGPIRTYFAKLGLEVEIADLYLALHEHGPQSISALSRSSGVERTRIYRLIDGLMASNLVEIEPHTKRGIIKAAPIANLRILITQREQELQSLQDELAMVEQVLARNNLSHPGIAVRLYEGMNGLRLMHEHESGTTSERYRLDVRTGMLHKGNEQRPLPEGISAFSHSVSVYRDTVAQYLYYDGEFCGIETTNKNAAAMQRRFFDGIWEQLTP